MALSKCEKRREGNDCRAMTSKKTWARRKEHRHKEKVGRDDRKQWLCKEAHAIDHHWRNSNDESHDDDKMVASKDDGKDNNFVMAIAPLAKKGDDKPLHCPQEKLQSRLADNEDVAPSLPSQRNSWMAKEAIPWPSTE